jgi:hypothetical protein
MESTSDTINNINKLTISSERQIIKNIIISLKSNDIQNALSLMHDHVQNENVIKAIHDYLLGVNCRYPYVKYNKSITECGIYNAFISKLDFEMYDGTTMLSNCPCESLACINWKYFTRTSNDIWTIAPMEFFTNEYFQQGFMESFKSCS